MPHPSLRLCLCLHHLLIPLLIRLLLLLRRVILAWFFHSQASAEFGAVNQIRASDDYATGVKVGDTGNANLYVGTSSMLAASLGLAPSKDVFWSNSTQRCSTPHNITSLSFVKMVGWGVGVVVVVWGGGGGGSG